jgi:CheY-like chemotaxis protein
LLGKRVEPLSLAYAPHSGLTIEQQLSLFSGKHILLAEDDVLNQEIAIYVLESLGLRVDLVVDGVAAVEKAGLQDYALILMDMQMPKLNGLEATRVIRRLPGREKTPILAFTANAFEEDRARCLEAGMNDHILKPIDLEVLVETLGRWLLSKTTPQTKN